MDTQEGSEIVLSFSTLWKKSPLRVAAPRGQDVDNKTYYKPYFKTKQEEKQVPFLDSETVCKILNFLISYLADRRYSVIDKENPDWKLKEIEYDEEHDEFYFCTHEA